MKDNQQVIITASSLCRSVKDLIWHGVLPDQDQHRDGGIMKLLMRLKDVKMLILCDIVLVGNKRNLKQGSVVKMLIMSGILSVVNVRILKYGSIVKMLIMSGILSVVNKKILK